jgi:DNA mismatch endonuclease Vsr
MPDIFSKEKRSEIMSKIKSKGTKIEIMMKQALEDAGIEFEYQPKMFGRPDFFIPPNIVVFCDSSFWHGRNWKKLKKQLSKDYWHDHIKQNIERDKTVNAELRSRQYIVLRFWDDEIEKRMPKCIDRIRRSLLV